MRTVKIDSRRGNLVLAALGTLYVLTAPAVLIWFVVDTWRAATMIDRALQLSLIVSTICGAWFLATALSNLGVDASRMLHPHRDSRRSHGTSASRASS